MVEERKEGWREGRREGRTGELDGEIDGEIGMGRVIFIRRLWLIVAGDQGAAFLKSAGLPDWELG